MNIKKFLSVSTLAASLTFANTGAVFAEDAQAFNPFFFGVFFTADNDKNMECYVSGDSAGMKNIFRSDQIVCRDPSLQYYNKNFYVCHVTAPDSGPTFVIEKSADLKNWTHQDYNVITRDEKFPSIWAPDLFVDSDGSAYVYFAVQYGIDEKTGIRKFQIHVSKAGNIEKGDFSEAVKIDLPKNFDNCIDAQVRKVNGKYYMLLKNENQITNNENKTPMLFKSDSPDKNFVPVENCPLNYIRGYEGFSICEVGGQTYVFADNYTGRYDFFPTSGSAVWKVKTSDFETGPYTSSYIESTKRLRHGSVIWVNDPEEGKVIESLIPGGKFPDISETVAVPKIEKELRLNKADYDDDVEEGKATIVENFAPAPDVIYKVPAKANVTIKNIVNPYGVNLISFKLGDDKSKLTVILSEKIKYKFSGNKNKIHRFGLSDDGKKWVYSEAEEKIDLETEGL